MAYKNQKQNKKHSDEIRKQRESKNKRRNKARQAAAPTLEEIKKQLGWI